MLKTKTKQSTQMVNFLSREVSRDRKDGLWRPGVQVPIFMSSSSQLPCIPSTRGIGCLWPPWALVLTCTNSNTDTHMYTQIKLIKNVDYKKKKVTG